MKCGDTCRHNISKLNSGLSVKLLQLPLQRSGKALEENLEGACSIFLQKSFILVRHIYCIFRLLRGGWLGCRRAFVKWHLSPYLLKFSLWSTATTHPVSAASPICSDFETFCPDWLHFGHFLCFGGIAASQLSHRIFPIYF